MAGLMESCMTDREHKFSLDKDEYPYCGESAYDGEHEIVNGKWSCPDIIVTQELEPEIQAPMIERLGSDEQSGTTR
jgi:hypothetical protein